jgi:rubrerythrin
VVEHTERPEIRKGMTTRDVYLVAAAKELAAHNLYQELAAIHPGGAVKDMLLRMAREELKHKEKVEYLYTNTAFPQTAGG